jgi:hypothetical protein
VALDRPLGDDGLVVNIDGIHYVLELISADEMARIREDDKSRNLRGMPIVYCFNGDVVRVWPTPNEAYAILRAPR